LLIPLSGGRRLAAACAALMAVSSPLAADEEHDHWRLVVADHGAPAVRVFELDGAVAGSFATQGPANLATGPSKTIVYAVQRDADVVQAVDSGITLEDHGDHGDIEVSAPSLLPTALKGDKPVHFVVHDGRIAVFYDDEGIARIYTESGIAAGTAPVEIDSGAPHHGVALTVGDYVALSIPHPDDPSNLPVGIRILDSTGAQVGDDHACPDLHGEASSGNVVALACATGILFVQPSREGAPSVRHLAYEGLPEGKSTSLIGGVGLQYFVGNFGADAVVVIDPETNDFTRISLPVRRVHFVADTSNPHFAFVLTEDGKLHQIDILKGEIAKTAAVTAPYSMDGHWSDPRPRVAVGDGHVFITEPLAGKIHVLDAKTLEAEQPLEVGGTPFNIVAVGGAGHDHAHGHGHGHKH
jgi:hypothetical protein